MKRGEITYVYGVVGRGLRWPGNDAGRLEVVASPSVAAVIERVLARDFGAETLEERLQDIGWVAPLARRHAGVLKDVMQHGAVIPAPLCTLFRSGKSLRESLAANGKRLRDLLKSLEGRQEWGIKVHRRGRGHRAARSSSPELQALERAIASAGPGQAYVLRKQRGRLVERLDAERADCVVDEVLDALDDVAVDARVRPLPARPALDPSQTMLLNAAFLVDIEAADRLHSASAQLASRFGPDGFVLEVTGPWPPYSFCDAARGSASLLPPQNTRRR